MSWIKQVSLHGVRAFLTKEDVLIGRSGVGTGGNGKPGIMIPGSSDYAAVFDDFMNTDYTDTGTRRPHAGGVFFNPLVTDTGNVFSLVLGTGTEKGMGNGGVIRMGPVAQGTQTPNGTLTALTQKGAFWKGGQGIGNAPGYLRFGVRLKCPGNGSQWNASSIFAGFADTGVFGTATFPVFDTGASDTGGIGQVANFMGFLYGENSAAGRIVRGVSARGGNTARQVVSVGTEPTVNTWQTWEMEFTRGVSDTGGTVRFYVNGALAGRIESPIITADSLTPFVGLCASDSGGPILDVDWIAVSGLRDTGG